MNYEQKYKEALERARKIENGEPINVLDGTSIPVAIFPELKESEGEKIRKQIISFLKEFEHDHYRSLDFSSWIAWLEKQEEQKINDIGFKAKDCYVSKVDGKIHIASKIKPEFKVNDWITFYGDQSFKIIKIEAETNGVLNYLLLNQNGHCSYYGKKYVDENARLWTIKDAKEGDILANDHNILILKESVYDWYTNGTPYSVKAYCGIKPNGNFEIGIDNWSFCGTLHIHPATKEQRELLFQKMKEKGYEWDADEKVVNKVIIYEQR